jgi:hypothetical protein
MKPGVPKRATTTIVPEPPKLGEDRQRWLQEVTDNFHFRDTFSLPDNLTQLVAETKKDLRAVPVLDGEQKITDAFSKLENDRLLEQEHKDLIWKCLGLVRGNFAKLDKTAASGPRSKSYQWEMNWKHTRAEVNQVYEAARLLNLSAENTRDAIIASIFSDSIKNRANFLIHNVHGAQGAAWALSQLVDLNDEKNVEAINRISRAIREHQVAPPGFMGRVVAVQICNAVGLSPELLEAGQGSIGSATTLDAIRQIREKIAEPFNKYHLTHDLTRILFTSEERTLLKLVGIEEWYVPHPDNEESKIAHAVIAGDHSINYNHPEGFAKIALIRGPDTEALFEDPTIYHSLDSAVASFADSYRVLRPEVQPLAVAGLRRTKSAVERVTAIMRELFNGVAYGATKPANMGKYVLEKSLGCAHERQPQLFNADQTLLSPASHDYTQKAIERVAEILQSWFDTEGEIPFQSAMNRDATQAYAQLPYWNTPLKYPPRDNFGMPMLGALQPLEQKQFAFADRIREIAVELLRAEEWIF